MKYSFMHKIFFALITVANVVSAAATVISPPVIPGDEDMEAEIKRCVASMTIEEKVGQMCELTLSVISSADPRWNPTLTLDKTKLNHVISRKKVGSILNTADIAITPEQWYRVVKQVQDESMKGIGIPCIYGLDMNHGASYTMGATLFPQNINMAATFNPNLAFSGGEIMAYETRACNVPWTYNPTVDLARNPLWPRFWENYGEDAYLSSVMATATVRGMQGTNPNKIDRFHIAANIKHYMGYGSPVSGKDRTHSSISEQEMREKHFAPYLEAIVKGGALSIMVNSTTNNGIPFHANARYLNQWLKEELDWDGLIVTDWADINNLYQREYVAANKKEAIAIKADIVKQKLPSNNGGFKAIGFGKTDGRMYTELVSDHPIDLCRYQVANGYMGRVGLINSGGESHGTSDLHDAVVTAVVNKRAGGMGLICGRKAFQKTMKDGVSLLNTIQDVYLDPSITVA